MKLVYSMMTGMAAALPQMQVPQGRFGMADIASIIANMNAEGDQAAALFKQFSALEGFDRSTVSNRPVNTVSSANNANELGSIGAFRMAAGYGCWCYFGDQHLLRLAKGEPVDDMDTLCKQLHNNYECLIFDTEDDTDPDATCYGWQEDHSVGFLATDTSTDEELVAGCASVNADSCKAHACAIEATFVRDFGILMLTDYTPIEEGFHYSENGGVLETNAAYDGFRKNNCWGVPGQANPNPNCCGSFPNRLIYNAQVRGCCNNVQTFHYNNDLDCCTDGEVIEGGSGRTDCIAVDT